VRVNTAWPAMSSFAIRLTCPSVCDASRQAYADRRSSVRYFAARPSAFAMNSACATSSSVGGGVVRVATGMPSSIKYSSRPAGEHVQSNLAGTAEEFRNWCGAFDGMLIVCPDRTICRLPRKVTSSSPSSTVKVSSKSWRCGGGPPPGGTCISIRQKRPAVSLPVRRTV